MEVLGWWRISVWSILSAIVFVAAKWGHRTIMGTLDREWHRNNDKTSVTTGGEEGDGASSDEEGRGGGPKGGNELGRWPIGLACRQILDPENGLGSRFVY